MVYDSQLISFPIVQFAAIYSVSILRIHVHTLLYSSTSLKKLSISIDYKNWNWIIRKINYTNNCHRFLKVAVKSSNLDWKGLAVQPWIIYSIHTAPIGARLLLTLFWDCLGHAQSFIPNYGPDGVTVGVVLAQAPRWLPISHKASAWQQPLAHPETTGRVQYSQATTELR